MLNIKKNKFFFDSDVSYIAKNGGWLFVSQLVNFISSIILASAFANILSIEDYGTYKYFLTLIGIFSIFNLPGINTAVTRSVGLGAESNIYPGLKLKIKYSLIGSISSILMSIYYFLNNNFDFSLALMVIALFIPFSSNFALYQSYLSGKRLFKVIVGNNITSRIIITTFSLATLFYTNNILILIVTYLAYPAILNIFYFYTYLKKYPPHNNTKKTDLSDGVHLSIMNGLGVITGSLQGIALWHFIGPVGLAIYSFALAPIEQIRPFIKFVETLFLPKMANDSWSIPDFKFFIKKIFPFIVIIILAVILYVILIPYAFRLLFPNYVESIIYSQILSVGLILTAINTVSVTILKAKNKIKSLYILNVLNIFFDIFILVPATYLFGIYGLVFSLLMQKSVSTLTSFILLFGSRLA